MSWATASFGDVKATLSQTNTSRVYPAALLPRLAHHSRRGLRPAGRRKYLRQRQQIGIGTARLRRVEGRLKIVPKCAQCAVAFQHVQVIDGLFVAARGKLPGRPG